MVDAHLVVVRTLNYLRSIHLPSYVALRLLLESVPKQKLSRVVDGLVTQATIRRSPRVVELQRFKSRNKDSYTYRKYSVPSPTSALADSYSIAALQQAGVLHRRSYVFSYRTPVVDGYTRSFEHFSSGYKERNLAVEIALSRHGAAGVVADIRSFYPSVNARSALGRLERLLDNASGMSKRDVAIVLASAKRCFASPDKDGHVGLRVGPEMSHVLADLALEDVDEELSRDFSSCYFRYVDDIVIVADKQRIEEVSMQLDEVLHRAGFSRSREKDAVVDHGEWSGHKDVGVADKSASADRLAQLKFRIKLFLGRRPDQVESLRKALLDAGVFLPVDQLLQGSYDRQWRSRISEFFYRGWRVALKFWFDSASDVAEQAISCRQSILSDVEHLLSDVEGVLRPAAGFPESSVARKWKVQGARFFLNRALYFADTEMLRRIRDFALAVPELAETEAVCSALLGDYSHLARMPGNAVSAGAQLASLRGQVGTTIVPIADWGADGIISADVAAHFAIRGLTIAAPSRREYSADAEGLLTFAIAEKFDGRAAGRANGYGAEVAAIGSNYPRQARTDAASTRFSSAEDVVLDALSLSTAYAS